jgi:6,7-dimethyl-8-ribityllumazine synthase
MKLEIKGEMNATNKRFSIVVARFNDLFSERLLKGAIDAILMHGGSENLISIIHVPGSFEIPIVVKNIADSGQSDAIICLGCLIKGETSHYDLISSSVTSAIAKIGIDTGVPCTLGIICADNMEQAMARSGSKAGNYGWSAAVAAIEVVRVLEKLK